MRGLLCVSLPVAELVDNRFSVGFFRGDYGRGEMGMVRGIGEPLRFQRQRAMREVMLSVAPDGRIRKEVPGIKLNSRVG